MVAPPAARQRMVQVTRRFTDEDSGCRRQAGRTCTPIPLGANVIDKVADGQSMGESSSTIGQASIHLRWSRRRCSS